MKIEHGILYLADLSPRFGTEPGKLRPVVVIQTDLLNRTNHPSTWILPCTTHLVGENIIRVPLPKGIAGNDKECEIMIDQSRSIDNRRIKKRLGPLPPLILKTVKKKIMLLGELT